MAALTVNSESFTIDTDLTTAVTEVTKSFGKRRVVRKSTKHTSKYVVGGASLSPSVSWERERGRLTTIQIGAADYSYDPKAGRHDHGRPWVKLDTAALGAPSLFPEHGGSKLERKGPGSGPYAGLLNLLATDEGTITSLGPATVDGQATTGFALTVQPAAVLAAETEPSNLLEQLAPPQLLEVFISEAGVPLRTVAHVRSEFNPADAAATGPEDIAAAEGSFSAITTGLATTEITALEPVVMVRPPPARRTIDFRKLFPGASPSGGGILAAPVPGSRKSKQ